MSQVFVDTSAVYALLVAEDAMHAPARAIFATLEKERVSFITSSYVVQETVALLQARVGIPAVKLFSEGVLPMLQVEWVADQVFERAMAALMAAARREISLTDWTSFTIMRERRVRRAFAFDDHFAEQGFQLARVP